jgi:hypothetical protein
LLVIGVRPLNRVLTDYVAYFNEARRHQGITQQIPEQVIAAAGEPKVGRVMAFPV